MLDNCKYLYWCCCSISDSIRKIQSTLYN